MTDAALLELAEADEARHLARLRRERISDGDRALATSLLVTVRAEPGEWSAATLALDYGVAEARVSRVLRLLPVERRGWGPMARLWPLGAA